MLRASRLEGSGRRHTGNPKPELAHAGIAQIRVDHRVRAVTRLDTLTQDDGNIRSEVVQTGFVKRGGATTTTTTATASLKEIGGRVLSEQDGRRPRGLVPVDAG